MAPHQQRVVDEKSELDAKLQGLQKFIHSAPTFMTLPLGEQWRLTTQAHLMVQLSSILSQRIAAF